MSEVVREHQVAGERVGEGVIEVEHLEQLVSFDGVEVTVGQGAHVGRRLTHGRILPEGVSEHVTLTWEETITGLTSPFSDRRRSHLTLTFKTFSLVLG